MMYFNFIGNIEFASRWKKTLSPDSVARGKATGQLLAQNRKDTAAGIYTKKQTNIDLADGIEKGKKLSATGRQAMLTKAASPNRTMRPTTQRGNLKAAPARNQLSSKSAQSFSPVAQNQATNANTTRMSDAIDQKYKQGKYATPLKVDASKIPNIPPQPKTPPMGSIGDDVRQAMGNKGGMADDIAKGVGRSMLRKKLLVGAGLAVAGGLYAAKKNRDKKQAPFRKLFGR